MLSPEFLLNQSTDKFVNDFYSIVTKIGKPTKVKKGQVIVRLESYPTFFFYINAGIFKTSSSVKGKEFILCFTSEGDVDGCPVSLLSGKPNNFSIHAVTEGEILICELKDFQEACDPVEYHSFINMILIRYLSFIENRTIETISLTAEEQYLFLLQNQSDIVEQLPISSIAAYLGVTIESLSRIRKKFHHR